MEVGTGEGPGQVKGLVELEPPGSLGVTNLVTPHSGRALGVPECLGRRGLAGGASGLAWRVLVDVRVPAC